MPRSTLRPGFGPTLPEIVAARTGRPEPNVRRRLLVAGAVLLVLAVAARIAFAERSDHVVLGEAPAFNLRFGGNLERINPKPGERLRLEGRSRGGRIVQSFVVRPLLLPVYRGEPGGYLPLWAERSRDVLAAGKPSFRVVSEGRAKVNDANGYSLVFAQEPAPERPRYGRIVLLTELGLGARRGVIIEMQATRRAGVEIAEDVGATGSIKQPYRSFRFGTEPP